MRPATEHSAPNPKPIHVFLCDRATRDEVFLRRLVGTKKDAWCEYFCNLKRGDLVAVYDRDAYTLWGPMRVVETGAPLERSAWNGRFPWQARFEHVMPPRCVDLEEVQRRVPGFRLSSNGLPDAVFRCKQAQALAELFNTNGPSTAAPARDDSAEADGIAPGALPGREQVPPRYRAPQGFDVRSKAERAIADILHRHRVECHYETPVPGLHDALCDFYLPADGVYVEYWGTPNDPQYRANMDRKRAAYRAAGAHLLELFPEDEADLEGSLRTKLAKLGVRLGPIPTPAPRRGWVHRLLARLRRLLEG